jgi:hypothetical protein
MKLAPLKITCKEEKLSCPSFHLLLLLMLCGILASACKPNEQGMGTQPPANVPRDVLEGQSTSGSGKPKINFVATVSKAQSQPESVKPKINSLATEKFYKKIKQKKLGSAAPIIRIDKSLGIFIHPGVSPTEVTFDVSGMEETLKLAFYIGGVPQQILPTSKAGTAGFEVFVDGKSLGRKRVDRFTNQTLLVDPKGVSKLRIVVDNDDGAATWDWFFIGLQ